MSGDVGTPLDPRLLGLDPESLTLAHDMKEALGLDFDRQKWFLAVDYVREELRLARRRQ